MYEQRTYRELFKGDRLVYFKVEEKETDLMIGAHKNLYAEAFELVKHYRAQLEEYTRSNICFLKSLTPVIPKQEAPEIVQKMCEASTKAGTGPMASVAGAIAELIGRGLLQYSSEIIVENGGDIFIKTDIPRKIGIYAGNSPLSNKIALEINAENTPIGICTSSGTVGHSLSFGRADAAVVVSKDAFLADAVATAAANRVKKKDDVQKAIDFAASVEGVAGVIIIICEYIGIWGDIKITRV